MSELNDPFLVLLATAAIGQETPPFTHTCGTRVEKINTEPGDRVQDGQLGTVLGSIFLPNVIDYMGHMIQAIYVVAWDTDPDQRVVIIETRIRKIETK